MHFGRSGRTVTRFLRKHIMGCRIHTLPLRGIALSAPRSNVPIGREPNVTLIVDAREVAEWPLGRVGDHMENDRKFAVIRKLSHAAALWAQWPLRLSAHRNHPRSRSQKSDGNGRYIAAAYANQRHDVFLVP